MTERRSKKRPRDANQLAKSVDDQATSEDVDAIAHWVDDGGKNANAVALGRLGGLKGGKARAAKFSKKRRSEIAKRAAAARWKR
jgi:hypothetical protein